MAFTVEDFRDLMRLLEERPEWRAELRRAVLTDELLALPELVRALAEAQRRTEVEVAALAEAQRRAEERLSGVEERLSGVEDRLSRVEDRLGRVEEEIVALAEAQRRTEVEVAALAEAQRHTETLVGGMLVDLGELKGDSLERRYRERGPAYFARLVRRARVLAGEELLDLLEAAVEQGQIPAHEAQDIALADVVIRGRRREDDTEVYLVVEVSWGVDAHDVERAARRAALLQEAGLVAVPVVAGKVILPEAVERARELRVWRLTDGQIMVPAS